MRAGCYELNVYCSNAPESNEDSLFKCVALEKTLKGGFISATGQTERECISQVQTRGWKIKMRDNREFCPGCVRADRVW
jgi:hypothetical protein